MVVVVVVVAIMMTMDDRPCDTLTHTPPSSDPHEDPSPSITRLRKISLGKKLLYAAQLGACETQQGVTAVDTSKSSAGAVALEAMGKVDVLDGLLKDASAARVALPEGRVFEDRDHADKVRPCCRQL